MTFASFGQVIVAEDFPYPDGSLVANSTWTSTSGTAGDFLVSSGQAVVQHGAPSEDVAITFTAVTGEIYFGFDFSVDDLGTPLAGTDFEYFAHLGFDMRIDIVPGTTGGDYSVGISPTSTAEVIWASDLTYGQTNRIILGFNQDTGAGQLWINPSASTDTSISTAATSAASITSFDLRQSDSSQNETVRVDDLMIGQTFDDVLVFAASTDPTISILSPSNGSTFDPGTTNVDVTWSTANLSGGETVNITVNGTNTMNVTSPFSIATMDGVTYNVTVDLVDGGILDSGMTSFTVNALTQVADIATLRAGTIGQVYELTSEAVITYIVTENTRNQKYIQDATGGILIDDTAGTLSTPFNIGDGITGLTGTLGQFSGVLQFVPSQNVVAASTTGNTITPQDISVAELFTNGENYESELIRVTNVTFADTGLFADNTNYNISDGADTSVCRVSFGDENLVGASIPTGTSSVIGLGGEFNGTYQVLPRYVTDVAGATLSVDSFELSNFSVFPNPTSTGFVNIKTTSNEAVNVTVFNILGKQVISQELTNKKLDVSNLNSGVYLVKLTQNGNSTTKKLVIN